MRLFYALALALLCAGGAAAQVVALTDKDGNPIGINLDDITLVRPLATGGSVVQYGDPVVTITVQEAPADIETESCGKLLLLDIVEIPGTTKVSEDLLIPVQKIVKTQEQNVTGKALLYMKAPRNKVYQTVLSYATVTASIEICLAGSGGGGSVAIPLQRIPFGTGPGLTSDADLTTDGNNVWIGSTETANGAKLTVQGGVVGGQYNVLAAFAPRGNDLIGGAAFGQTNRLFSWNGFASGTSSWVDGKISTAMGNCNISTSNDGNAEGNRTVTGRRQYDTPGGNQQGADALHGLGAIGDRAFVIIPDSEGDVTGFFPNPTMFGNVAYITATYGAGAQVDINGNMFPSGFSPSNPAHLTWAMHPYMIVRDSTSEVGILQFKILKATYDWDGAGTGTKIYYDNQTSPYARVAWVYSSYSPTGAVYGSTGGNGAHSEGTNTSAWDYASHAEGSDTKAWNRFSHAQNLGTRALGRSSSAAGEYTIANSSSNFVIGRYNVGAGTPNSFVAGDPTFEIGIGSNPADRRNALTVNNQGLSTFHENVVMAKGLRITTGAVSGRVFTSDASGNGTWQAPSGGTGGYGVGSAGKIAFWRNGTQLSFNTIFSLDSVNNWVGLGTAAPGHTLHVKGSTTTTAVTAFRVDDSGSIPVLTANNGGQVGFGRDVNVATNTAFSYLAPGASGFGGTLIINNTSGAANTNNVGLLSGTLRYQGSDYTVGFGQQFVILNETTGGTTNALGIYAAARNSGVGSRSATLKGIRADAFTNQTGGTINDLMGVQVLNWGTTGVGSTITNAYGLKVDGVLNSGTVTNTYGLHVGDMTTGTQTNTPYSILTIDPNARQGFSGNTMIGGTATGTATQPLHVNGNARVTGAFFDSNNEAGTSGQVLSSTVTGTDWVASTATTDLAITGTTSPLTLTSSTGTDVTWTNGTGITLAGSASNVTINNNVSTGVSGGQTINGGTAANDDLTIEGTTNGTKTTSYVNLQTTGGLVGIGNTAPTHTLDVAGSVRTRGIMIRDWNSITGTGTVTASSTISYNRYDNGDQATLTVNLPASPTDGQICRITFLDAVTTLTISGNGANIYGGGLLTSAVLGSSQSFTYSGGATPGWIID